MDINGIKVSATIVRKISKKNNSEYYALEVPINDEFKISKFIDSKDVALLKIQLEKAQNK